MCCSTNWRKFCKFCVKSATRGCFLQISETSHLLGNCITKDDDNVSSSFLLDKCDCTAQKLSASAFYENTIGKYLC